MTTATLSNRPSRSFNWADDEEDDFDFESWKATADTSAPSIKDLTPLQLPPSEDESQFTVTKLELSKEHASSTVSGEFPLLDDTSSTVQQPSDGEAEVTGEAEWQCAHDQLVCRALQDSSDMPAYGEMSYYDEYNPSPHKRANYTQNWNQMKANSGLDCRRPVLYRSSSLRQVFFFEEDEITEPIEPADEDVEAYERFSEIDINDLPQLQHGGSETDEEEAQTPPISTPVPIIRKKNDEMSDLAKTPSIDIEVVSDDAITTDNPPRPKIVAAADGDFDFDEVFEDPNDTKSSDEGYHSTSPAVSPTFTCSDEKLDTAFSMKTVGPRPTASFAHRKRPERHDSMDALVEFRKNSEDEDAIEDAIDDDEDPPKDQDIIIDDKTPGVIDLPPTLLSNSPPSPDATECKIDIVNDEPLEAIDQTPTLPPAASRISPKALAIVPEMPSSGVEHIKPNPSISDYVSGAVSTGCGLISLVPCITVGVVIAGAVVGGLFCLARRR
ncbi:uncharacterized protein K460DRAFT_406637 [Cucurbitaria berberidis CBS 394.84]|uniref:Uncharacterized protein n=1 Tax=Cucurbitaria berberidis CBS 394.84 TaxID=1168544 RepID=A0A9P4GJI6_9PLEO|nr:uncharacterized protein K460DRAFT_406637 [Cucurbitaria berberidis CBS 394.84]KAF1846432.1 hypothetical protein K460DRAFT_406637 [Cucurbitaria berberidis CBS 394.84]